jgi:hypothetical protein
VERSELDSTLDGRTAQNIKIIFYETCGCVSARERRERAFVCGTHYQFSLFFSLVGAFDVFSCERVEVELEERLSTFQGFRVIFIRFTCDPSDVIVV